MGNITFLIGNGFDLNVGLKTRFTDFYQVYTEIGPNDSSVIKRFKKEILKGKDKDWKDWKDFELGMGQQSVQFGKETPAEDFIECFNDFVVQFNEYLQAECAKVDWDSVDSKTYQVFAQSIYEFYSFVKIADQSDIKKAARIGTEYTSVCFLQFNYSDISILYHKNGVNYPHLA